MSTLTLHNVYSKKCAEYRDRLERLGSKVDTLYDLGKDEAAAGAQQRWEKGNEKMHEGAVFDDDARNSILFFFHLDWLDVFLKLCSNDTAVRRKGVYKGFIIPPSDAKRVLRELKTREDLFRDCAATVTSIYGLTKEETKMHLEGEYKKLKALLQSSIDNDEPIDFRLDP